MPIGAEYEWPLVLTHTGPGPEIEQVGVVFTVTVMLPHEPGVTQPPSPRT